MPSTGASTMTKPRHLPFTSNHFVPSSTLAPPLTGTSNSLTLRWPSYMAYYPLTRPCTWNSLLVSSVFHVNGAFIIITPPQERSSSPFMSMTLSLWLPLQKKTTVSSLFWSLSRKYHPSALSSLPLALLSHVIILGAWSPSLKLPKLMHSLTSSTNKMLTQSTPPWLLACNSSALTNLSLCHLKSLTVPTAPHIVPLLVPFSICPSLPAPILPTLSVTSPHSWIATNLSTGPLPSTSSNT